MKDYKKKEYFLIEYKANTSKWVLNNKCFAENLRQAEKIFNSQSKVNMKETINLFYIAENKKFIC